jgi:D-aminoacyl-tRNA deacylase
MLMKLILASKRDIAANNIASKLLELFYFKKSHHPNSHVSGDVVLTRVEGGILELASLPPETSEVIVASRHESKSGSKSLTVHAPGELETGKLAVASPSTVKAALIELARAKEELGLSHQVSLEATHHGPVSLDVPVTFVEIGSLPEHWGDEKAGAAAAQAIMAAAAAEGGCRRAVGVGGTHYAPRHTEATLQTDVGVGHIIPKHVALTEELLEKTVRRTHGKAETLLLDWKGMSAEQRDVCKTVAEKLHVDVERARSVLHGRK